MYKRDLDILILDPRTKMKFVAQGFQKSDPEQERQTDRCSRTITPQSRVVKIV